MVSSFEVVVVGVAFLVLFVVLLVLLGSAATKMREPSLLSLGSGSWLEGSVEMSAACGECIGLDMVICSSFMDILKGELGAFDDIEELMVGCDPDDSSRADSAC